MRLPEGCIYRSYRSTMLTKHNTMPIIFSLTDFAFFPTCLRCFSRVIRGISECSPIPYDHPLYSRIYFAYYARIKIRARDVITGPCVPRTWSRERRSTGRSFRCRDPARGCISEKKVPRNAPRAQNEDDRNGDERPKDEKDDAHGVGRKTGRCGFQAAEEEAAAPSRAVSSSSRYVP